MRPDIEAIKRLLAAAEQREHAQIGSNDPLTVLVPFTPTALRALIAYVEEVTKERGKLVEVLRDIFDLVSPDEGIAMPDGLAIAKASDLARIWGHCTDKDFRPAKEKPEKP